MPKFQLKCNSNVNMLNPMQVTLKNMISVLFVSFIVSSSTVQLML